MSEENLLSEFLGKAWIKELNDQQRDVAVGAFEAGRLADRYSTQPTSRERELEKALERCSEIARKITGRPGSNFDHSDFTEAQIIITTVFQALLGDKAEG